MIGLEIKGSTVYLYDIERRHIASSVTGAAKEASDYTKNELRSQVQAAGLGQKLGNAWRAEIYPRSGVSLKAASLVYSKAKKLHQVFDQGVTIRSKDGAWLAIPTPEAGLGYKRKGITPAEWETRTGLKLRFVYRRGRPSLLVSDGLRASQGKRGGYRKAGAKTKTGLATVIIFILVPQVTLRKRLNIQSAFNHGAQRYYSLIVQKMKQEPANG